MPARGERPRLPRCRLREGDQWPAGLWSRHPSVAVALGVLTGPLSPRRTRAETPLVWKGPCVEPLPRLRASLVNWCSHGALSHLGPRSVSLCDHGPHFVPTKGEWSPESLRHPRSVQCVCSRSVLARLPPPPPLVPALLLETRGW